jgi:hypothetical protein
MSDAYLNAMLYEHALPFRLILHPGMPRRVP